jgi:DtxR family transcriptional regulator, Mn-dependent transcriptional regulator
LMGMENGRKLSASLEDYLEAIYNLSRQSQVARSKDIAELLGVARSSVTGALRLLKDKGMIRYEPYDHATLTKAGCTAARDVVTRHNILKSFFINVLGLPVEVAQQAACRTEHTLGPHVIAKFLAFIEFVGSVSKDGHPLADEFQEFCARRGGGRGTT